MQDLVNDVRETIAAVLDEQCSSLAVHRFIDGENPLDARLHELAAELGWLAVSLPEAFDGIGLGAHGLAVLNYELGRAAAPGSLLATSVAVDFLARCASAVQQTELSIGDAVAGSVTLALGASLRPARDGGSVRLLGDQSARAALVAGDGDDIVLIEIDPARAERLAIWDETRPMFALPATGNRTIATFPGARPLLETLYAIALAADSAGAARGTLDRTVAYMKERQQFGRPIGGFQALKHRAADHQVNAIACDQLVWQACEQMDRDAAGAFFWAAMAKANVTEAALGVAGDCVQLHGGVGFTREYDPHLFLKRIRLNEALLAPNGMLRDEAERAFCGALRENADILEIADAD